MDDRLETDLLTELLAQRHEVLAHVCELSRRQQDVIGQDDMTLLYRIFSAKQTLLEKMQAIEQQLEPFRSQDPESRRWRSPDDRRRAAEIAGRCEVLLEEIKEIDQRDIGDLSHRRDASSQRLDGAHKAAEARTAYNEMSGGQSGKIDLTSEM